MKDKNDQVLSSKMIFKKGWRRLQAWKLNLLLAFYGGLLVTCLFILGAVYFIVWPA